MPNRILTACELDQANALLDDIRARIDALAGDDPELRFAYNRKVYKELTYDERGTLAERNALKKVKRQQQGGLCFACREPLALKYCILDRLPGKSWIGYTVENTQLICFKCDTQRQIERGYA